ncbi:RNA polymerase sigma factor [Herbidospora cretacea]|uniref:RNA polymerase sigma factor n=1 Tax=Herbidospora cretacea TaxID=28444 RepID=UPI0007735A72|nr:sigma-70 family RNA polymerase sigma factor [Herbidospora cretacea]
MTPDDFEAVYRGTYERLTRYAVRRCASAQDAADVVADTYAVAWRRRDRIPGGGDAVLWLYAVARRVLSEHRRRDHRHRDARLDAEMADLYARTPGVEMSVIGQTFRALPDGDRELLALVAWEGLGHDEIAVTLGITRNNVRVRLHRARRRFAKALAANGVPTAFALEPVSQADSGTRATDGLRPPAPHLGETR